MTFLSKGEKAAKRTETKDWILPSYLVRNIVCLEWRQVFELFQTLCRGIRIKTHYRMHSKVPCILAIDDEIAFHCDVTQCILCFELTRQGVEFGAPSRVQIELLVSVLALGNLQECK